MEGQLSFKAIVVGFIVDVFATQTIGGVAGGMMVANTMRGPGGPAAMNALANPAAMTQQMTAMMSSPAMIVATIASGVLGSIIGGYVTGVLAPSAEIKNAAVMGVLGLALGVLTVVLAPGLSAMMPSWVTFISCALTLPAALCGGALRSMKTAPSHSPENLDRFQ